MKLLTSSSILRSSMMLPISEPFSILEFVVAIVSFSFVSY
jgi:hypothetical protein